MSKKIISIMLAVIMLVSAMCISVSAATGKAGDYYYTDINFEFAPNGELLYFHMYSPVDIVSSNYGDQMLSIDELMEIAKEKLIASSASNCKDN